MYGDRMFSEFNSGPAWCPQRSAPPIEVILTTPGFYNYGNFIITVIL